MLFGETYGRDNLNPLNINFRGFANLLCVSVCICLLCASFEVKRTIFISCVFAIFSIIAISL